MKYVVKNNDLFEKLLEFYKELDLKIKSNGLDIYLYGSLSYIYYTKDSDIVVGDIDLITNEVNFPKIIELFKDEKDVICEITDHNSVRLFKNGAKLSIHSLESANEIADFVKNVENIEINGVIFKSLGLFDLIKFYKKGRDYDVPRKTGYDEKFQNLIKAYYGDLKNSGSTNG